MTQFCKQYKSYMHCKVQTADTLAMATLQYDVYREKITEFV